MPTRPILPLSIASVAFRLIRSGTTLVLFTLVLSCPNLFAGVSGPFTYTSDSTGVTITKCDPSISGAVSVPSTIEGQTVTSIGDFAFYLCTSLTSITIPNSVTSIADSAFKGCTSLTNVTFLGNAPTTLGSRIFDGSAPGFTVFYLPGATGFTSPTWQGYASRLLTPPTITTQPKDTVVPAGQPLTLSVNATGSGTLVYQWRRNGAVIAGATAATYTISALGSQQAGFYDVLVGNGLSVTSSWTVEVAVEQTTVTPASREVGAGTVPYQIMVTSNANWAASTTADWVTLSRTSGVQDGNLLVTAAANVTGADRTAILQVNGATHTITQRAASVALQELWAFGSDAIGQLGDKRLLQRLHASLVSADVKTIAACANHSLILKTDGSLWAAGSNMFGQLGDGTSTDRSTPVLVLSSGVKAIAAGSYHSLILKTDGSVWAMGNNGSGQLGVGTTYNWPSPVQVISGEVQAVATGYGHTLLLKIDGSLWALGDNSSGQLGDGTTTNRNTPVQVVSGGVQAVAAGYNHSLILKTDGSLWAVGQNAYGQLGDGTTTQRHLPVQILAGGVQAMAAGRYHSLILKTDGSLWAVGQNGNGQLGDGTTTQRNLPVQVLASGVRDIAAGEFHSLLVKTDGSLWAFGENWDGQLGDGTTTQRASPVRIQSGGVHAVAAGSAHSLILKWDGGLWTTGSNSSGQLGDGTIIQRNSAVQILSGEIQAVAACSSHSLFLKTDGSLWAMGENRNGQLGDGTWIDRNSPVQTVASGVQAFATGSNHNLILKTDGSLWAVGYNHDGELGDGTTTWRMNPVQILASGVRAIAAGSFHSLVLKTDGSLWAMGQNGYGELGDGTTTTRTSPVQILAGGVQAIAAGHYFSLIVKTDGSLWAMGQNQLGQLGDGTTTNRPSPVQILTSGVQAVAAGFNHSLIVKTDGSLWAMGSNFMGQLGDGTTTQRNAPVQIFASGVQAISGGGNHSLVLRTDGTLWSMGENRQGQLGDGTTTNNRVSPVFIAANVQKIAAGDSHSLFVARASGDTQVVAPQIMLQPASKTASAGDAVTFSVVATGTPAPTFQWYFNGQALAGATSATLTIANVQAANVGSYYVVVTNGVSSETSNTVTLSSNHSAPTISTQPGVVVATGGSTAKLTVAASGTGTLTYQWRHFGAPVTGANSSTLTINNFGPADAGAYDVVVNDSSATPVVSQIGWIRYQSPAGWLWGSGSKTALGIGDLGRRDTALVIAKDVAEVFAGYWSTFFLKKDGSVWAAGSNWDGQLGVGTENIEPLPLQVGINDVVQIAPGMAHTLFLKRDGSVWAVGVNWYGQLGNNSTTNSRTPVYVTGDATQISAGYLHSACLKRDGSLWVWGRNEAGQLGDVTSTDSLVPIQVATEVRQISAGAFSTVFIKNDNTLWGMGEWAQSSYPSSPAVAPLDSGVESVAADSWRLLYIKTGGQLWHRSGIGNFNSSNLVDTGVNKVVSHGWGTTSAYSKTDGTVFAYGVARGTASLPAPGSAIASNAASIACGEGYLLYLTADGLLWSVGSYSQGQLGDGHTVAQPTPAHLLSGVVDTATSENSSFALLADGSLWGMGQNSSGQLGDGTTADRAYPVKISTGVATISAGQSHTLYIDISNTLWACGSNNSGQLGNGTSDYLPNSIPISVAADVVACAAGYNHSLFLKRDGTLMAMGNNGNGQLNGVLDGKPYNSPTTVASDVAACAAGSSHSLFLKRDGTLMAMGFNGYGQIGDGTTNFSTPPVTVASDVVACAAGYGHSLFLKRDGTLMAMGFNGNGQLGDGTTANRTTPVAIATGVVAISAGSNHSLFLKTDGSLWAMGGNYYGAFGDGTVLNHLLPMQIANNIGGLAAGGFHSLFIQKPIAATAPVITSQPSSMSLLLGSKLQLSVSATGTGPLDYQWYKDGVAIPGERSPQLSIGFLNASDFGQYTVVVTNQSSAVPSQAAVITQGIPPAITTQPVDSTIALGAATTLTVVANGTPPISYQWYKGDSGDTTQPIAGATTASYTTPALSAWSRYWVRISSKSFYTDSRTAFVKVNGGTMTVKDWTAHLGVPTGKGGALDIPASDGVTNLIKFALGVAPMDNASSHLPFPTTYAAAPGEPKQLALVFTLNPSAQGIRYVLEVSADASNWTEAESVTDVLRTNPDGTKLVRMREAAPPAATRRFARLRIEAMPF